MKLKSLVASLGPGLLWAGAAIGVSHLVQSTRAGAGFGFQLVWVVILINLLKYPFFEFAPRYVAATGNSLLDGYRKLGKWAVVLFVLLTISTMFTLMAAISFVTAGLFSSVFPIGISAQNWTVILLILGAIIVIFGKYSLLDKMMKGIIILLTLSTIIAVIAASGKGYNPVAEFAVEFDWTLHFPFILAFAGWMPSAIDISVWHSFWSIEKNKSSNKRLSLKQSLFDFNTGYIGTTVLSVLFLSLGALVMYGTGASFSESSTGFATQLISLFTAGIGEWAFYIIAIAAITTMLSTTLTCLDAYPRVLKPASEMIFPKIKSEKSFNITSLIWIFVLVGGTLLVVFYYINNLQGMVDLATTLSFLTAPVLGIMNYVVVTSKDVPKEFRPGLLLKLLSWIGIIFLTSFGAYYLYARF